MLHSQTAVDSGKRAFIRKCSLLLCIPKNTEREREEIFTWRHTQVHRWKSQCAVMCVSQIRGSHRDRIHNISLAAVITCPPLVLCVSQKEENVCRSRCLLKEGAKEGICMQESIKWGDEREDSVVKMLQDPETACLSHVKR